tara:strand:+ start:4158 stop:4520 length:363 start_codon:yes stop_codon:yes gene_type:complete
MDLTKMDPIARKLNVHTEAFTKALEDGNANEAKAHLVEVLKFGNFLNDDLAETIHKQESKIEVISPTTKFVGAPIHKFDERGAKFDTNQRDRQLPGTVIPARTNSRMRPHTGTFGRAYTP